MKSSLVNYTQLSPNYSSREGRAITRITPHCVVGQCKATDVASWKKFNDGKTASMNYVIGKDGEILCNVLEENRAWTSGSKENDTRAITIECASDATPPYKFNDKVWQSLKELILDICKRYQKKGIIIAESADDAKLKELNYPNFMIITYHKYFQNVECAGEWCISHFAEVRDYVNNELLKLDTLYKVQVGAFKIRENAEKLKNKLVEQGYSDAFIIEQKQ